MHPLLPPPPDATISSSDAATKWIVRSAKENKRDHIGAQQRLVEQHNADVSITPMLPLCQLPVSHMAVDPATLLLAAASLELQDSEPRLVSMGVVSLIGTYTHTYTCS